MTVPSFGSSKKGKTWTLINPGKLQGKKNWNYETMQQDGVFKNTASLQ